MLFGHIQEKQKASIDLQNYEFSNPFGNAIENQNLIGQDHVLVLVSI
jgi:hypothetical protein